MTAEEAIGKRIVGRGVNDMAGKWLVLEVVDFPARGEATARLIQTCETAKEARRVANVNPLSPACVTETPAEVRP